MARDDINARLTAQENRKDAAKRRRAIPRLKTSAAKKKARAKVFAGKPLTARDRALLAGASLYGKRRSTKEILAEWLKAQARRAKQKEVKEEDQATVLEVCKTAVETNRLALMLEGVVHDQLDPGVLDGEITLPPDVVEMLLADEKFTEAHLQTCVLHIAKDNLAELVGLLKSCDPKIKMKAWDMIRQLLYGDKTKVEHSGPGGGAQQLVIKILAPNGQERLACGVAPTKLISGN